MSGKPLPRFESDEDAESFVASADLTDYDLSGGRPVTYELKSDDAAVRMRLPRQLLDDVKAEAGREGIPYERFIRRAIEDAMQRRRA